MKLLRRNHDMLRAVALSEETLEKNKKTVLSSLKWFRKTYPKRAIFLNSAGGQDGLKKYDALLSLNGMNLYNGRLVLRKMFPVYSDYDQLLGMGEPYLKILEAYPIEKNMLNTIISFLRSEKIEADCFTSEGAQSVLDFGNDEAVYLIETEEKENCFENLKEKYSDLSIVRRNGKIQIAACPDRQKQGQIRLMREESISRMSMMFVTDCKEDEALLSYVRFPVFLSGTLSAGGENRIFCTENLQEAFVYYRKFL